MWALEWTPLNNGVLNLVILLLQLGLIVILGVVVTRMLRHVARMDREIGKLRAQRDEAQAQAARVLEQSLRQAETVNGETIPEFRPVSKPRRHLWLVPPTLLFVGLTSLKWRRARRLNHRNCERELCPPGPKSYPAVKGGVADTAISPDASKPSETSEASP